MRLCTILHQGHEQAAVRVGERVVPVSALASHFPYRMRGLIASGSEMLKAVEQQAQEKASTHGIPVSQVEYALPVPGAEKIICVGLNYRDHAIEGNQPIPETPVFFIRYLSSFVAHGKPLVAPKLSTRYDYEAELAVVIGKTLRHASEAQAAEAIFGYTVAMDGSVRDYQKRTPQWTLGKNFDDSASLGPEIVTAESVNFAKGLAVTCQVNGETLQQGNTAEMIFSLPFLIATLTEVMTLHAGDIILTGTPAGVGFARKPPLYLKGGDVVTCSIEGVGTLQNPVVAES
jgi:2-keto-4-pentenoate hydratase/2-oxohepta-3-ene-1,7-dioic acid hydratase in catechol pathway